MQGKSRVTAFWGVKGMKVADALQTQWLQSSKLVNISTKTVHRELRGMGY